MTLSYNSISGGIPFGNSSERPANPSIGQIYYNGQIAATEIYTSSGWAVMGALPESATIGTATDVGTNREYNNAAASVTFTPSASGGLATSFTATSTPGGYTGTGSSSPVVVPGLASGTSYTFAVVASNAYGNALATTQTNSITATSVPTAPSIGTAINPSGQSYAETASASVPFTQSANGGKAISNYKYSTDGTNYTALSPAQTSSPLTISGLTPGSSYSFYLKAVNENGDSAVSSVSNSVTVSTVPQTPTIGTVTVTNATTVSIPFTAANNGGSAITSYTVTSSPSIALSVSGGTTSPLTVTGSFAANTAYTFTIRAVNATGSSSASASSNSVTPLVTYTLSQTFNSSGTYTVPAGKTKIAIVGVGAGGAGGSSSGGGYDNGPAQGGGSGGMFLIREISTSPGTNYTVTIGSGGTAGAPGNFSGPNGGNQGGSGGITSFGNILTANGATGGRPGNAFGLAGGGGTVTYNTGIADAANTGQLGSTGLGGSVPNNTGVAGNPGVAQSAINSNDANISTFNGGGSGAGGGSNYAIQNFAPQSGAGALRSGASGGSPFGGTSGHSAYVNTSGEITSNAQWNNGGNGQAANGRGGGGGGSGGPGASYSPSYGSGGGTGGAGGAAQILVYVK